MKRSSMKLRSLSTAIVCVLALSSMACAQGGSAAASAGEPGLQASGTQVPPDAHAQTDTQADHRSADRAGAEVAEHGESHAASHAEHHADAHGAMPELADGQRWQTDEPLRKAMSEIREDVARRLPAYHQARLQAADADALATAVEGNIDYMVANCELAPEPDAVLHVMIGRMMGAIAALRTDPASADGMPQLVSVVNDYRASFDHEGLPPLTHD